MAFFNKRSKKKDDSDETEIVNAAEETAAKAQEDSAEETAEPETKSDAADEAPASDNKANPDSTVAGSTRFTLVVENVFTVDENESIAAVGNLHGKITQGDKFWIIHPKFPNGIEAEADTLVVDKETPETAENCRVAIKLTAVTNPGDIPKYAVISNIAPQTQPDPSKPIENPFLIGLTCEYNRLVKDNEFTYTFMVALLTSRYVTPADMELEEPDTETGRVMLKGSKISFKLLRHPSDETQLVLPIFTDMAALRLWNNAFDNADGDKLKTVLMPFERCAEIGTKNGGIVVNPFGPAPVFIGNQNIENTIKLGRQALERQKTLEALDKNSSKSE